MTELKDGMDPSVIEDTLKGPSAINTSADTIRLSGSKRRRWSFALQVLLLWDRISRGKPGIPHNVR